MAATLSVTAVKNLTRHVELIKPPKSMGLYHNCKPKTWLVIPKFLTQIDLDLVLVLAPFIYCHSEKTGIQGASGSPLTAST